MEYGLDFLNDGVITADTYYGDPTWSPGNAFDNNEATYWSTTNTSFPHWLKYDLGAGITRIARKIRIHPNEVDVDIGAKDFIVQGSNNGSAWTDVYSGQLANSGASQEFEFSNSTGYRWYRFWFTNDWESDYEYCSIREIECMEVLAGPVNVKAVSSVAKASISKILGVAIASVKKIAGLG